jgi:hypothetical protein
MIVQEIIAVRFAARPCSGNSASLVGNAILGAGGSPPFLSKKRDLMEAIGSAKRVRGEPEWRSRRLILEVFAIVSQFC